MSTLDWSNIPAEDLAEFLEGPALPPPDGIEPIFLHPPNHNGPALFACIFTIVVSTIVLLVRFYVRIFYVKQRHVVDLMAFASYIFFLAIVIGSLRGVASGSGFFVHQWNLRAKKLKLFLYTVFIGTNFYGAGMLLLKTAILWEWMRIFVPLRSRTFFFWACTAMITVNGVFYVTTIILSNLACRPFAKSWDKTIPGRCIDVTIINIASAAVNFCLDLAILLLPQRVIWKLHMSFRKRLGVSALFAVGILACAAAAARIGSAVAWHRSNDTVFHFSFIAIWAMTEFLCGFLIFSMPAMAKAIPRGTIDAFFTSIQSWAGSVVERLRRTRQNNSDSSWPSDGSGPPHTYRNIDNEPPMVPLKSFGPDIGGMQEHLAGPGRGNREILQTVEFTATESIQSLPQPDSVHTRQDGWYLRDTAETIR